MTRYRLDRTGQRLLDQVTRAVNREFRPNAPFHDPNGDGVFDCENFVAEKLERLAAAGVPPEALIPMRVFTSRGVSHAVLVVACDRSDGRVVDLVLDNLSQWCIARGDLAYTGWEPMPILLGQAAP